MNSVEEQLITTLSSRNRWIRIFIGLAVIGIGLFLFGGIEGEKLGVLIGFAGLLPLATGFLNYCPINSFAGKINKTRR